MFTPHHILIILFAYLMLLFGLAYYAEKREDRSKSIVNNPYVYSLSLAVYCTSWTFYGSVGWAATSGISFLTIYLGPSIAAVLWTLILPKIIRIAKANRITTISDFISARYGKSIFLSALVTLIAVAGIGPYLGLQIKAIITTFGIITGNPKEGVGAAMVITMILGVFAVLFGARRIDSSERHGGLVFAIAFESIVKLAAFLTVGIFVTYFLFNGFGDITTQIEQAGRSLLITANAPSYFEWTALLILSMMAVMLLPRQFQMSVVENYNEDHIRKAARLFPLYLLLINIFVLPIAFGGVLTTGNSQGAESFVLTLPLVNSSKAVTLFVFIGGFAAATGMVIVESVALSTMVMNSLVMPVLVKFGKAQSIPLLVINIKRLVIMGIVFIGYFFAISIGGFYSLVDMGLKSFEAVALFAPAFFIGLFWKRANKKGAAAGLVAGFSIWLYTLMIPAAVKSGLLDGSAIQSLVSGSSFLNPEALFGVSGLGKWSHTLFWSMLLNLFFFFGISVITKRTKTEELQSLIFVEGYKSSIGRKATHNLDTAALRDILVTYLGNEEAEAVLRKFLRIKNKNSGSLSESEISELHETVEKELSGAFGPGISAIIFRSRQMLGEDQDISESIQSITEALRLSKNELAEANRQLSYLKEFSENIIESAPVGIIIVDNELTIKYCNNEMQRLAAIDSLTVLSKNIGEALPWFDTKELSSRKDFVVKGPAGRSLNVNVSLFKDPSGGYVVVFEDITEKLKMEQQLKQASKLAGIGKLTAGLSHEIGNPLAAISSLVQELREIKACSDESMQFTKESLNAINAHIQRIVKIVRSLGDFASVAPPVKTYASIDEILQQTLNLVKYDKRFANVELAVDLEDLPKVFVNTDQIQQVFMNLILNSLDAMEAGGRLSITGLQDNGYAAITFSDTGEGIAEDDLEKIFDPFYTTKPYGKGTGLGLSICYGIISDHGGALIVRSKKGEGSAFIVRLPADSIARENTDN
ncbi:MAG: PAS domain-containing protein [Nitrospirae bacterium]|nr:PAS domain-containing protein [Nitrospirota bacterium]